MIPILFVIDNLSAGGLQRQTTALITRLDRSQFAPEVICIYAERAGRTRQYAKAIEDAGIPLYVLDLTLNPISKIRAGLAIIRHARRMNAALIHSVSYHANILTGWTRSLLPSSTRLVSSVRAENTDKQLRTQRRTWKLAAEMVVNSSHLKEELVQRAHLTEQKITVIPNGLDLVRFSSNPDPDFKRELVPEGAALFLLPVRVHPRKAPYLLVEAIGQLQRDKSNIYIVLVGEVENQETQSRIDAAVNQYGLEKQVIQHPPSQQVEKYYHAADFTVLPALYGEGLPNVVIESMAGGTPVILSEAANRVQVIENGVTGWEFETGSVPSLAETVDKVLVLTQDQMTKIQANCRTEAQKYAMDLMIQRHQEIYFRVLNRS